MTRFLIAVSFGLLLTSACVETNDAHEETQPSSVASQGASFEMDDLDGVPRQVTHGVLVRTEDGARWETLVDGAAYLIEFRTSDTEDVLAVFGPEGRLLYRATAGNSVSIYGWTGDGSPAYRATYQATADSAVREPSKYVDGDNRLRPQVRQQLKATLGSLSTHGNSVAPMLAASLMHRSLVEEPSEQDGEYRQASSALTGLEEAAIVVAIAWTAFEVYDRICNRGNSTASCEAGSVTTSITCNRCEGTARCHKTSTPGGEIVETGDGGDEESGETCHCWCA